MKRGGCGDFEWDWGLMCKQSACTCDLLLHPSSRTVCLGWLGAAPLERAHLCVCLGGVHAFSCQALLLK